MLHLQVELIRPVVIACLGAVACSFAARTLHIGGWPKTAIDGYFRAIDTADAAVRRSVTAASQTFTAVALVHPSFRHASASKRSYRGRVGDLEAEMLRDALAHV
jgi:uracil-DNA glycosylase